MGCCECCEITSTESRPAWGRGVVAEKGYWSVRVGLRCNLKRRVGRTAPGDPAKHTEIKADFCVESACVGSSDLFLGGEKCAKANATARADSSVQVQVRLQEVTARQRSQFWRAGTDSCMRSAVQRSGFAAEHNAVRLSGANWTRSAAVQV